MGWGVGLEGESLVSHMHSEALTSKEKQVGGCLSVCLFVVILELEPNSLSMSGKRTFYY